MQKTEDFDPHGVSLAEVQLLLGDIWSFTSCSSLSVYVY